MTIHKIYSYITFSILTLTFFIGTAHAEITNCEPGTYPVTITHVAKEEVIRGCKKYIKSPFSFAISYKIEHLPGPTPGTEKTIESSTLLCGYDPTELKSFIPVLKSFYPQLDTSNPLKIDFTKLEGYSWCSKEQENPIRNFQK